MVAKTTESREYNRMRQKKYRSEQKDVGGESDDEDDMKENLKEEIYVNAKTELEVKCCQVLMKSDDGKVARRATRQLCSMINWKVPVSDTESDSENDSSPVFYD